MSEKNKVVSLTVPKIFMGAFASSTKKPTATLPPKKDEEGENSDSGQSKTSSLLSIPPPGGDVQDEEVPGPSGLNTPKKGEGGEGGSQTSSKPTRTVAMKRTNPRPNQVVPAKRRAPSSSASSLSPAKSRRSLSPQPPAQPQSSQSVFESLLARKNIKEEKEDIKDSEDETNVSSTKEISEDRDLVDNLAFLDDEDTDEEEPQFYPVVVKNSDLPPDMVSTSSANTTPVKKTEAAAKAKKPTPKRSPGRKGKGRKRNTKKSSASTKSSSVASLTPQKKSGPMSQTSTPSSSRKASDHNQRFREKWNSSSSSRSPSPHRAGDSQSAKSKHAELSSASSTENLFVPIVANSGCKSVSVSKLRKEMNKKTVQVVLKRVDPSEVQRRATRSRPVREVGVPVHATSTGGDEDEDSVLVEVCVDNVASLEGAAKGGAHRIELCSALSEGGLTPTVGLLKYAKSHLKIPIFCMIRARGGDFLYSEDEVKVMEEDIRALKKLGADGFVFGALTKEAEVDVGVCKRLIKLATPLPCTFHRAFDLTAKPLDSLERIASLGFTRILTSGQKSSATEGWMTLRLLVKKAAGNILILAGAGIKADNVKALIEKTGVREVHGSARTKVNSVMTSDHLLASGRSAATMGSSSIADNCHYVCDPDEVARILLNANTALLNRDLSHMSSSSNSVASAK